MLIYLELGGVGVNVIQKIEEMRQSLTLELVELSLLAKTRAIRLRD